MNSVTRTLNAGAQWLEENKGAGAELHELEEETKAFEAKLAELKAQIDPKIGQLYTPTGNTADEEETGHEEL